MPVFVGTSTLNEISNNGNNVLEVQNNYCAIERITSVNGRDAGDVATSREYGWNRVSNRNHPSGGMSAARYTAPYDGSYMIYVWLMTDNDTTHNNNNWRLRVNNSSDNRQVYVYTSNMGNYHREAATGVVLNLAKGDFVSVYTSNFQMYGNADEYTRFNVVYLG